MIESELLMKSTLSNPDQLIDGSVALPFPFSPGLPCRFPIPLIIDKSPSRGGASAALTVMKLAEDMVRCFSKDIY